MPENNERHKDFVTPQELYGYLFNQIKAISESHRNQKILGSQDNFDEELSIDTNDTNHIFIFMTQHLNIAKPDTPEGAYDNTFVFQFDDSIMSLQYDEALPRRKQKVIINTADYDDVQELRQKVTPFFERFNQLLRYFGLAEQVELN